MKNSFICTHRKSFSIILAILIVLAQILLASTGTVWAVQTNVALNKAITASSYTQTYAAGNSNDGNINTYWEGAANTYPNTLTVDLGSSYSLSSIVLKLNPSWGYRTQTLAVLGSNDNSVYSTYVSSSTYSFDPSKSNTVTIPISNINTRYVRLSFTSNSQATAGQIAEFEVYSDVSVPTTDKYEAENAVLSGGAAINTDHTGYSGTGFVDGYWNSGAKTSFTVNVASSGNYDASLRYANASGAAKTVSIYVNNVKIKQTSLPSLANWDTWASKGETLALNTGNNTIAYVYDSGDSGNVNFDYISLQLTGVTPTATPTVTPTQTATPTPTPTPSPVPGTPDLVVTNITWSPINPSVNNEVTFSCVIKNQGTGSSPSGVKHGISFMIDGVQVNWCDTFSQSLAPAATATLTANYGPNNKATWKATAGVHTISAFVDDVYLIAESNENNNTFNKTITITTDPTPTPTPTQAPTPTPTPTLIPGGRGANVPWIEYEAESGTTNATRIGPSRTYYSQEAEASGRMAVKLDATGKYVEIKAQKSANSIVVRYCIPDAAGGGGINSTLSLYVNGNHRQDLGLTSKYAWVYGDFPWTNNPADGKAHKYYDEVRAIIGNVAAGDTIKLQKDLGDTAGYFIIDLIDLETVPGAIQRPSNSLSITDYGATANDESDDTDAIANCIAAAKTQGKVVWIPSGNYKMNSRRLFISSVTVQGAGMWYSTLSGTYAQFEAQGSNCKFYDLSISGEINYRNDNSPDNAFNGYFGTGSEFKNLWIEHQKCGFWVANYSDNINVTDGMIISNCRMRNLMADGVNYCKGTKNSVVEQSHFRNTGDDSLATWSADNMSCSNIVFKFNTIQSPWLANCIAVYGGTNIRVEDNLMYDAVYVCGGVNISSSFTAAPFGGTIYAQRNTITRCGSESYIDASIGAIWVYSKDSNINASIVINDNEINDSTYSGISLHGPLSINNATISNNKINGTGTYGFYIQSNAKGSATFTNNSVQNARMGGLNNAAGSNFTVNKGTGNIGW